MTEGPGGDERRHLLREYREFIRANHPDRGGDPDEFVAGLERLRALMDAAPPAATHLSGKAAETTVFRRGRLPGRLWRHLTERQRRRNNPRVE
ncbi:hypothetical protein [Streptomyces sp. SID3343]|uniref:hypothetical protein n=1 Tax=Streptomyces sp. SID3343 TaxID=2690260 RepID=UPI00136F4593|nr:hypothetical protein [Streptomyces sp. SID3343]MYW05993.1 hypothetical protein [Streptomyces sp. SID3343]